MEQGSCIENFGWTIHRNVTQLARGNCVAGSIPAVPTNQSRMVMRKLFEMMKAHV